VRRSHGKSVIELPAGARSSLTSTPSAPTVGVESICVVLSGYGVSIASSTYYQAWRRPRRWLGAITAGSTASLRSSSPARPAPGSSIVDLHTNAPSARP
jgi:hypothetical protein